MKPAERRALLDHAHLLTLLRYDPSTGLFTWLVHPNRSGHGRTHAGDVAGTLTPAGYINIGIQGTHYLAHRLAVFYMTKKWPERQVDHKNGGRADNRWVNLREADHKQQRENATPQCRSKSGVRGVYWFPRTQQWQARINHHKRTHSLGYHDTLIDAAAARLRAERGLFTHHREHC